MPNRIIGIDLGSYSVKVAVIERSFRTFSFVEFYERPIQYNELLSPEESKAIALQGLIDDYNMSWDVASSGLPSQRVTSRLLTFPFGSTKKIDQAITFEIESFIPFAVEEMVLDYTILWQNKNASRVMAVYVQRGELVKLLSLLDSVNVDPRFVCVEGVDQINLINLGMVPPEGAYAIIDIGHEKSTVTICHGRNIGYIRAVSLAGKAITEAIANKLSVPYEEAEKLKIEMGQLPLVEDEVVDDTSKAVIDAVRSVVDEFLLHLRQTFFTFRETEDVPVEGVYLTGGTSRLPGIDRYLSDALKLNVTYLNCLDFHFCRIDRADAHRHVIPQALALSLKGVAGSGPDINMRTGEFSYKGDVEQIGGNVRRIGIVVAIIIFLALVNFTVKYYSVKKQVDKLRDDVVTLVRQAMPETPKKALNSPKAALSLIKSKESDIQERMDQLNSMVGVSPLDILNDVSTALPERDKFKIEVNDVSIADGRVTLSGIVDDFKAVDTVKQAFEDAKEFKNVSTGNVSKGVKGEVKFKLSMELVGEGDNDEGGE
ncbi:MAG: pilus assembly protein PilM [Deltaproteobacteria bacterium]|nr:pilus assembly protein PilM [Deltaproteobacteria bacterium]